MVKTLRPIGNSYGIIIDKPILDLLKIEPDTELEVTTDGERLIISPVHAGSHGAKVKRAHARAMKKYDGAFRKLAK